MKKKTCRLLPLFLFISILLGTMQLGSISVFSAAALDTNLLVNPGGDQGGSGNGWTGGSGTLWDSREGGRTGNYLGIFAQGYTSSTAIHYQDVDVSTLAAQIDGGTIMVSLSGYYMKTGTAAADIIKIQLQELDANGNVLSDTFEQTCSASNTWEQFHISEAAVPGSRTVRVTLSGTINGGGVILYPFQTIYNYAGFDDMSLILSQNTEAAPAITQIADQATDSGNTVGPIAFTASDSDNPVSSLTAAAYSSDQALISNSNIHITLTGGNGTITFTTTGGQTGQAYITVAVSDGTKTTRMRFNVTVYPAIQLGSNIIINGDGSLLDGWTNPEGRCYSDGQKFIIGTLGFGATKYFIYQEVNIAKFSSFIDTGLAEFTSACDRSSSGEYKVEGLDEGGNVLWTRTSGSIDAGTRKIRVTAGGTLNATIDNVSVIISEASSPKMSDIADQRVKAGTAVSNIPFSIVYSGSGITLSATSTNTAIVQNSAFAFGGSQYQRTISFNIQPNVSGTALISVKGNGNTMKTFNVTAYTYAGKPSILSVNAGDGEATVEFSVPATDGGSSITAYTVTSTPGNISETGTASPITLKGLTNGVSYTFTVKAANEAGMGPASDPSPSVTPSKAPTVITGDISGITYSSASVEGNVTDDGGDSGTVRGMEYKASSESSYVRLVAGSWGEGSFSMGLSGLSLNTAYDVRAFATNGKGTSYGDVKHFTTLNNTPPTISGITDPPAIDEDNSTEYISFTIGDGETPAEALTVEAASNSTALIPDIPSNILLEGSGTNRTIKVTPAANQSGTAEITITVTDQGGLTAQASFNVTVRPVNDAPTASGGTLEVTEDTAQTGTFTASDIEGDSLTYYIVTQPGKGTVTTGANGSYTYTPNANATGSDSFTFKANDGKLDSNAAVISITIAAVNDAPVADQSSLSAIEDTAANGILSGSDIEGSPLTYSKASDPGHGAVTVNADGSFIYIPEANYAGSDSFTFKVNDGELDSLPAIVTITVTNVNDAPVAAATSGTTNEDTSFNGVLTATDADSGDILTFILVSGPAHGTAVIDSSGTYTYTPAANYYGPDSFTYKVNDGAVDSNIVEVTITVNSVNDIPEAQTASYTIDENTVYNGLLTGSDIEESPLTFRKATDPVNGSININIDGRFTYTPDPYFRGTDSFTFIVNDGTADSSPARITMVVNNLNDAPVAQDGTLNVTEDTPGIGSFTASDMDGDALTYLIVTKPVKGTVTIGSNGNYTYTPAANITGSDSFTFRANDGLLDSNNAVITVTINAVNDPPQVKDSAKGTDENAIMSFSTADFEDNYSDIENDPLSTIRIMTVTDSVYGTLKLDDADIAAMQEIDTADLGRISFVPAVNTNGSTEFTWKGSDGTEYSSNTATMTLNIGSNAADIEAARQALHIGFAQGDSSDRVTHNITLPLTGLNGTTISWKSSDKTVISNTGEVFRPSFLSGNAHLTVTATVYKGGMNAEKSFALEVLKLDMTDAEAVSQAKAALGISYAQGDSEDSITKDIALPTSGNYGTTVIWTSDNPSVISSSGIVSRPSYASGDAAVAVVAAVSKGAETETRIFNVTVIKEQASANASLRALAISDVSLAPSFDKDITSYTGTINSSTSSIKVTPVPDDSTAIIKVNGSPLIDGSTGVNMTVGSNTINIEVAAQDGITKKIYTVSIKRNNPDNGSDNSPGDRNDSSDRDKDTSIPPITPPVQQQQPQISSTGNNAATTLSATATAGTGGTATASVTQSQMQDAVNEALEAARNQGGGTAASVEIQVTASANSTSVETSLPRAAVGAAAAGGLQALTVSSPVASITFDSNALSTIARGTGEDVSIIASRLNSSSISTEVRQLVGNRPVFDFSVTSGGSSITQFGGNVTVSVPYTPSAGEDLDAIVIYYIDENDQPQLISNCIYDPSTGRVTFNTNHFSKYAVGYNKISFKDVSANAWYGKAVGFIAAREISGGTGDGNFSPDAKLTRGQFIVMLMKAYGIAPDANPRDNFADAGSTYYTGYLAAAKRLGISGGVGNDMFAPEKEITRQEMFTLLYNALKAIDKLPKVSSGKTLSSFSDAGELASWAKDAMSVMVRAGITGGSGGKLSPSATATRAEMAQVLYNLLSK